MRAFEVLDAVPKGLHSNLHRERIFARKFAALSEENALDCYVVTLWMLFLYRRA